MENIRGGVEGWKSRDMALKLIDNYRTDG